MTLVDKDKRDQIINGTVLDKGIGQYELSFTLPSPGTYEFHITIDNEHIKNSPFTLTAIDHIDIIVNSENLLITTTFCQNHMVYVLCLMGQCMSHVVIKYLDLGMAAEIFLSIDFPFKKHNWGVACKDSVIYIANSGEQSTVNDQLKQDKDK